MKIAVDISLYPLDADYIPPIDDIIERLQQHAGIEVRCNTMSTQLRGDYDTVMAVLHREFKTTFERIPHAVFAVKILNNPHDG